WSYCCLFFKKGEEKIENFQFVGAVMFFSPPTHPFKNRCAPQGHTPLAAARGLAALHPARRATAN
uniref:hypothetical protein n=2 Tax=Gemmiger formicilis TaxID=745368 RepID=UPI003FF11501